MTIQKTVRQGSGIVDCLVGVLCLGLLASLAMPMLLAMRSQGRLANCAERMRNICLAAHNFHDSRKRLPPATLGSANVVDSKAYAEDEDSEDYWKNFQHTSSLALISPYMEMIDRYNKLPPICYDMYNDFTDYTDSAGTQIYKWHAELPNLDTLIVESVGKYLCPEDNLKDDELRAIVAMQPCEPFDATAMETLDGCRDIVTKLWHEDDKQLGLTNYVGCIGVMGKAWTKGDAELNRWRGALSPTRVKTTLETVADGTSRTIMYGESLGDINEGERTVAQSWLWGGGARITGLVPFGEDEHPDHMGVRMLGNSTYSSALGFGSKHNDVVYFALCDASCNKVSTDIDREILYQLAGGFDGGAPRDFFSD